MPALPPSRGRCTRPRHPSPGHAPQAGERAQPSFYRFKLGAIEITVVSDGTLAFPAETLWGDRAEDARSLLTSTFQPSSPVGLEIDTTLVNTGDKLVLIDAGCGVDKFQNTNGRLLGHLASAGYAPGDIDMWQRRRCAARAQCAKRSARARPVRRRVILVRGDCTTAGSRAQRHGGVKPPDDAAGSGSFGPARAGAPGWSDGSGRTFLFRHDRNRGRYTSERVGPCLCGGPAPDAGEDYAALAKTFPTPPASAGSSSTAMKSVSPKPRSCAISRATCRKQRRRSSMRSGSRSKGSARGQDDACGLAVEAEFLCRFHGGPNDQSRSRTLHG